MSRVRIPSLTLFLTQAFSWGASDCVWSAVVIESHRCVMLGPTVMAEQVSMAHQVSMAQQPVPRLGHFLSNHLS